MSNNKDQIAKIKSLACKKHVKIYRLSKMGLSNQEVAKELKTNAGHVFNALKLYKAKPSYKKIADNIETIISEKKAMAEEKKVSKKSSPKTTVKKSSKVKKTTKPTAKKMAEAVAESAKTAAKVKTPKKAKKAEVKEPSITEMASEFPTPEVTELKETEVIVFGEHDHNEPEAEE